MTTSFADLKFDFDAPATPQPVAPLPVAPVIAPAPEPIAPPVAIQQPTPTPQPAPMPAAQPVDTGNLTTRAMLVNLSISTWQARKYDRKASQEVADNHHTTTEAGRYNKRLLPVDAKSYQNVLTIAGQIRAEHYRQTLAWSDDGLRILPAANFLSYSEAIRKMRAQFEAAVAAFVAEYPQLREDARAMLNGLYNEADYPTDITGKFAINVRFLPLPDASDFRVSISDQDAQAIRQQIEADTQNAVSDAVAELVTRVYDTVKHLATVDTLKRVHADGIAKNIAELVDVLPRLNLTGNPHIDRIRDELQALNVTPGALKSELTRNRIAASAKTVAADMRAWMGGVSQ